jgi:hypothetical protein
MKAIPELPRTEIEVKDDQVRITQFPSYSGKTITIPVAMWSYIVGLVEDEIAAPVSVEVAE